VIAARIPIHTASSPHSAVTTAMVTFLLTDQAASARVARSAGNCSSR
jgi:hypothetical protein